MDTHAGTGLEHTDADWFWMALSFKADKMQAVTRWFSGLLMVVFCLCASAVTAQEEAATIRPEARPHPVALVLRALRNGNWDTARGLARRSGAAAEALVEWHRLRAGLGSVDEITQFLDRHPDWPGLARLRQRSERVIAQASDREILSFFETVSARTGQGILAHAAALERAGDSAGATAIVRRAWAEQRLTEEDQAAFLTTHGAVLKPLHEARLDSMLWKGWHEDARRMFDLVSKDQIALARARIGLRTLAGNVDALIKAVPDKLKEHPGLAHARFEWRVRKGRWSDAKALLLERSASAKALGRPWAWANRRRELARDEMRDGSAAKAYAMASSHFLSSGSHYADLEWLSGYLSLTRLDRPEAALAHFQNHDDAVVTPISQGRAGYWKGRTLRVLGRTAEADMEFAKGAGYQTSFYGLLAAEAAGLPFDVGLADVPDADWQTSPLLQDSLFQVGRMLVAAGERNLAELFWTHLAEQLGEHDAALLGRAAIDLGEPHLAVMIGKAVARRGVIVPEPYYPLHSLARSELPVPPELALSIARRESEFDPVVVSGVGARGLMQVMPATAKEVAAGLGLSAEHSTARLTADPVYNARLGSAYLEQLVERFDGNIIMVSAAYNAGPSRPVRWMGLYGDPRGGSINAMIDWIEGIPFRETRNYVMRVSESLPVFRAQLGQAALPVPFSEELLGDGLK